MALIAERPAPGGRLAARPGGGDGGFSRTWRGIDLLGSSLALLALFPLLALLALLIRLDSPGPALFFQWRLGLGGRPFRMWKFRTMRCDGQAALAAHLREHPADQRNWEVFQKLPNDPRCTDFGRFLRRWSLDELPQLWNVWKGEMSLVGPRPLLPEQRQAYGPAFASYVQVLPGITGLWQVSGRNRTPFAERASLDEVYVRNRCFRLNAFILLATLRAVMLGEGAC